MPWNWKSAVRHAGRDDLESAIKSWRETLREEIKDKDKHLTSTIELIGGLLERRGMVRIGQQDSSGWEDLYLGWRYRAWALLVRSRGNSWVRHGAMGCALALAYGERKFATWCRDTLLKRFPQEEVLEEEGIFMLNLCHQWKHGRPILEASGALGAVFDAWDHPKKLASAIEQLCDYHCAHSRTNGRGIYSFHPYTVIPAEVLAVYRVRESLNLVAPMVSHPLLDQVFARIPVPMPKLPPDPDLKVVMRVCQELEPKRADLKRRFW